MAAEASTLDIVPNPDFKPDGAKTYLQLINKYGFRPTKPNPFVTPVAKPSVGTAQSNSIQSANRNRPVRVPARVILYDLQYLCPVTIGTPGKVFNLNFDTGSADLWLWSTELPSTIDTTGHRLFNPSKSRTFQRTNGSAWEIMFNDQSFAGGTVGTDVVSVGGLKAKGQTIELANKLSPSFQSGYGDGLFGLAFGTINKVTPLPVSTFAETIIAQRSVPVARQLFTAYLNSYRDAKSPFGKSFYTFGGINKKALGGQEIHYAFVDNSQGLWQFQSTAATITDREVERFDNTAVADTGSSLALIDDAVCDAIYSTIPGAYYDSNAAGYVFPTNTSLDQLPTVKLAVGDKQFAIRKADLSYADAGNNYTYGGIQSRGSLSFDIFGVTFLKGVYAIFDIGNSRFGVVPKTVQSANTPKYLRRNAPSISDRTSFAAKGLLSSDGSTMAYGTFVLLTYYFSRGSARFLLAGFVCLFLLQ